MKHHYQGLDLNRKPYVACHEDDIGVPEGMTILSVNVTRPPSVADETEMPFVRDP